MTNNISGSGPPRVTVGSLRRIVLEVAQELASREADELAAMLRASADLRSHPADELLAMREALVRSRVRWDVAGSPVAGPAGRALNDAKRLAIEL